MDKTKILVVDDQPANITAMLRTIASLHLNVETITATSGNDALSLQFDHRFALVILDVQMPEMDGFEVAELMRSHAESHHIPIIFVTANAMNSRHMFAGYQAGAVDFLRKPYDPHILGSKIKVFVELDRNRQIQDAYVKKIEQQQQKMVTLKEAAEAANRSKTSFLANISHEIRTPLGAMIGFAELLNAEKQCQQDSDEYIARIRNNGHLLLNIINNVLDLSKIEAGQVEIEKMSVFLVDLMRDIEGMFQLQARHKGLHLKIELGDELPHQITTDPTRLKQILANVIGNALKFTVVGGVTIRVSVDSSPGPVLRIEVRDTGIGLSKDATHKLFKRFSQSDNSTTRKYGGTGLGLCISRELAQELGGDLSLTETEPGIGSVFTIEIDPTPVELSDSKLTVGKQSKNSFKKAGATSLPIGSQTLENHKILLVEDSSDNRMLIERLLSRSGAHVETAANGLEGVKKARSGIFDVVLMDIQMPGMDGIEATSLLRREGYKKPIIALTAHAFKSDRDKCIEAGYTDHVSKPINFAILVDSILELVPEKSYSNSVREQSRKMCKG